MKKGWIAVDFDGTLAEYTEWKGMANLGEPVPAMLERVKAWLAEGQEVRIFTARADDPVGVLNIRNWCQVHLGQRLEVTNTKDFGMIELWDDRAVQVEKNTGRTVGEAYLEEITALHQDLANMQGHMRRLGRSNEELGLKLHDASGQT